MKLGVFSDLHAHPWAAFSKTTKNGLNSRLVQITNLLSRTLKSFQGLDAVLFSGDLFHTKMISVETYDLVSRAIKDTEVKIFMIPGNHDEASAFAKFHALRALDRERIRILDPLEGYAVKFNGLRIVGVPYLGSKQALIDQVKILARKTIDILLIHTGFAGATMGFDYIADQKQFVQPDDIRQFEVGLTIAGHFHQPQIIGKKSDSFLNVGASGVFTKIEGAILVPGAPLQHTFGDEGSERGIWILDWKKKELHFRTTDESKFVKVNGFSSLSKDGDWSKLEGNFVSLTIPEITGEQLQELEQLLGTITKGYTINIEEKEVLRGTRDRLEIELDSSPKDVIKKYIREKGGELSRKALYRAGMRLLGEAERS